MSKHQEKVLVALKPEPRSCPADRWTTWARSITDRHERIAARQGRLIMTLAQPLQMFTSIHQRLEKFTLAVFPRLRVSIGPILWELTRAQSQPARLVKGLLAFPKLRQAMVFGIAGILESHIRNDRQQLGSRFFLPASMTVANVQFHSAQEQLSAHSFNFPQSPVSLLFARMHRSSHGVVVKQTLVQNESRAIAERVVQEHLRVEQKRRGDMIIHKQTTAGTSVEDRRSELEAQITATRTRERSWPEKPPEINVDQLTEQVIRKIDHRITAYRERLGRAF